MPLVGFCQKKDPPTDRLLSTVTTLCKEFNEYLTEEILLAIYIGEANEELVYREEIIQVEEEFENHFISHLDFFTGEYEKFLLDTIMVVDTSTTKEYIWERFTKKTIIVEGRKVAREKIHGFYKNREFLLAIQQQLLLEGYTTTPLNGFYDQATQWAIGRFQKKHRLAFGGLTLETVEKLGIDYRRFSYH